MTPATHACNARTLQIAELLAIKCPAGDYFSVVNKCKKCSLGTWSAAGSTTCQSCPAGQYSDDRLSCKDCPAGEYSESCWKKCKSCGKGKVSKAKSSTCTVCQAGQYADRHSNICRPCLTGTYSHGSVNECKQCPRGSYSGAGEKECHTCIPGQHFNTTRLLCADCLPSFYSPRPDIPCTKCAPEKYSGLAETTCRKCPRRTKVNPDQTGCASTTPTPTHYRTPAPTRATPAPSHYLTPAPTAEPSLRTEPPVSCVFGDYFNALLGKCVECTEGDAYSGTCTMKCSKGYAPFNNHPCRPCVVNTYNPSATEASNGNCIDCPLTMVVTDERTKCVYCEPSFYRQAYPVYPYYQRSQPAECLKCAEGTYSGFQDTGCHDCPPGFGVNAEQTGCQPADSNSPTPAPTPETLMESAVRARKSVTVVPQVPLEQVQR